MLASLRSDLQGVPLPTSDALERLVYVIGTPRGGTTVLFNCIGLHERILALPANSHFMNHIWRYRRRVHERLLRIVLTLPDYYDETLLAERLDDAALASFNRHVAAVLRRRRLSEMYQLYPIALALSGQAPGNLSGLLGWADKMTNTYGARTILRHMPGARLVLLTRDPRAAISSLARRSMQKQGGIGDHFDPAVLVTEAISWRRLTQDMLRLRRWAPSRTMLVRFEDFTRDPAATLQRIFAFAIGESPGPAQLDRSLAALPYWTSNDPADVGQGISTDAIDRWRRTVDPETEALINAVTWRTARKLGYDLQAASLRDHGLRHGGSPRDRLRTGLKLAYIGARENIVRARATERSEA